MHTCARPCTLVGEPGQVPAALPSIRRGMYRGGSWESINHLRTPAVGAGKVGYSWETGIPARPAMAWYPGCSTGMRPASVGIGLGWRDPCVAGQPWPGTRLGAVVPAGTLVARPCRHRAGAGAAFLLLQFGGLLPSGTVPVPPCPCTAVWGVGRRAPGGSHSRSRGPAARRGHRAGPTGVWAKHLAKGISE